nr:hypothetical protein [Tanacetum cinerariifolium]
MGSQLRLRFEQEVMLLKKATTKIAEWDQRLKAREEEIKKLDQEIKSLKTVETAMHGLRNQAKNLETLLKAEVDMKKTTKAENPGLAKELESLRAQFVDLQVSNNQLSQQVSTLRAHVTGGERIKSAFEEFKKYEDDRVNSRCAEIDARLDALSIDFDEELYPHMLTVIIGHRWVIGHGLCLAVKKCSKSTELRHVFVDVVSARVTKVMSEGLKHGIECGKANLDIATIEAYDPEADAKYVGPSCSEGFEVPSSRSAGEVEGCPHRLDHGIPILGECFWRRRSLVDPSEGVPVSVPTVAPQGLAILLSDAATQTEISKDKASPRLLRSKSLPPMYNLDWP